MGLNAYVLSQKNSKGLFAKPAELKTSKVIKKIVVYKYFLMYAFGSQILEQIVQNNSFLSNVRRCGSSHDGIACPTERWVKDFKQKE